MIGQTDGAIPESAATRQYRRRHGTKLNVRYNYFKISTRRADHALAIDVGVGATNSKAADWFYLR